VRRLELTEIARADLKSIKRYSDRTWGTERTERYMAALRDAMKRLVAGTVTTRERDDLRPGLHMAVSGRHCVFFEQDSSRVLVVRVLHERMDHPRHLNIEEGRAPADD
jgi:toxin ParE1/3/4